MTPPTGIITFLFTDIEGSTRLWERFPDGMRLALAQHDLLLRETIEKHGGYIFKTVGDAFCAAFPTAPDALSAAHAAQLALLEQEWGETGPLRIRMGLHTGAAEERGCDYFGQTLNRVARLQGAGHGQQTLLSQATCELIQGALPSGATLQDLGMRRLKDLAAPEHVWQLLHPALPQEFPPLKCLDYLPTNLPAQTTSFIGREKEMAAIRALLKTTRLLTLTGSGGTGKTRLSLQVGADVLDDYKDGVWLVELAALTEAALLPQTVATALHLREERGRPISETLMENLKDKSLLLLLDNCEHLLAATAQLADFLLKYCPQVRILASSRERLGISGEQVYRVPSLRLPEVEQRHTAESLLGCEAIQLFTERAVLHNSTFSLSETNASALVSVCHRLDGIPLAIELAAARIRSLSVEEIDRRLDQRFRLLTGGSRTLLPRHQTLQSLIDWSYALLNETEKSLLCRLSVFSGGWSLTGAEQICSGNGIDEGEVLDLLTGLVDKSLVIAEEQEGASRYRFLETIRQYSREKLQIRGEAEKIREKHQEFYLKFAEETSTLLYGPQQAALMRTLEIDHENFREGLIFCIAARDRITAGIRLGAALRRFWEIYGYIREGREWFDLLLTQCDGVEMPFQAMAHHQAACFADRSGDYESSRQHYEKALAVWERLENRTKIAGVLSDLAIVARKEGDLLKARSLQERVLRMRREAGHRHPIAISLCNLGAVLNHQGDFAEARNCLTESLALFRELGDAYGVSLVLTNLTNTAEYLEDHVWAEALAREGLALCMELGDKIGLALYFSSFAVIAFRQSHPVRAARLLAVEEALRSTLGAPLPVSERTDHQEFIVKVRTTLGEEAFSAAWAEGHAMTVEQALYYARDEAI